jgi:hypothetical protein
MEDLRKKLRLLILKPTPYTFKMANQTVTTNKVNLKSENPYPWYFIYHHLHSDEK